MGRCLTVKCRKRQARKDKRRANRYERERAAHVSQHAFDGLSGWRRRASGSLRGRRRARRAAYWR